MLERFLAASDRPEILELARELSVEDDPAAVPQLIAALKDPLEARREGAAYSLAFRSVDGRATRPLIRALEDLSEAPVVRCQVAEALAYYRKRKSVPALIRGSRDASLDVRFWCVFALGSFVHKRKCPRAVMGALAERLDDMESPRGFWPIRLEALAMLGETRQHATAFARELERARRDPADDSEKNWAGFYQR
jgi:HEAT repeat protein